MQAVNNNNESYFSLAATYAALGVIAVPKKYVVGALATIAGGAALAVTRKEALLTQAVAVLASSAASGYVGHRIHDLAQARVFQKLIAPAMAQVFQQLNDLFKGLGQGNSSLAENFLLNLGEEVGESNEVLGNSEAESSSLSSQGEIPASVQEQLGYQNSDNVKQSMIRLVAARAYLNSLSNDEERKAVATQLIAQVFDGATTQATALELLGTKSGTSANHDRLEDLGLGRKHMPEDALTGLAKADRSVGKKELHKFLLAFIELAK